MAYILDGLVILIVAFCIWRGARRGLMRTLILLVGFVLAAFVAGKAAQPIAGAAYDALIAPKLEQTLVDEINSSDGLKAEIGFSSLLGEKVTGYLQKLGLKDTVTVDLTESKDGVQKIAHAAADEVVRPAVVQLMAVLITFLLFLILLIVVWLLSRLIDKVFKLPVLKQANKAGGAILGILQGVFWAAVYATALRLLTDSGMLGTAVTGSTLDATWIVSRLSLVNWIR